MLVVFALFIVCISVGLVKVCDAGLFILLVGVYVGLVARVVCGGCLLLLFVIICLCCGLLV